MKNKTEFITSDGVELTGLDMDNLFAKVLTNFNNDKKATPTNKKKATPTK